MTSYDAGDIVLVHYPFTDLTTSKKRPAVILSPRIYTDRFGDVVVMPLTSQPDPDPKLALSQWRAAGLLKPTWIKPIIGTLSTGLIERGLGKSQIPTNRASALLWNCSCTIAGLRPNTPKFGSGKV
jgi:mRNA interferase MazF